MQSKKFIPICMGVLVLVTIALLMIQEGGILRIAISDYVNVNAAVDERIPANKTCEINTTCERKPPSDPSLFVKHNVSLLPVGQTPTVCVAVLTCKRLHLLKKTIPAFINYFHRVEPNITYEIVLVDNGSGPEYFDEIRREFPINKLISFERNYGIAAGMNTMFFGACTAPYILSVEDDWGARWQNWSLPSISQSIAIIENEPEVSEVWLRDFWHGGVHSNRTEWIDLPAKPGVHPVTRYKKQYRQDPGPWGAYTNGASLKSRAKLEKVGRFQGINGEAGYADKVGLMGFAVGITCFEPTADCDPDSYSTGGTKALFEHLGGEARSPGHKDFGPNDQ